MTFDLVVRGGSVVDGTGAPARVADVGVVIDDDGVGRVAELATTPGQIGRGRREIDADGLTVTPGWIDLHTHFDGQATWDPLLAPSCHHGVTTLVMGNCAVGFAPARPDQHDWLISLMETVEDIPSTVLAAGLPWGWESFDEYLQVLDRQPRVLDVAAQVPHAPLRVYVMGERGADPSCAPTDDEIATMAELTRRAIEAGAVGFSTSRTDAHRTADGSHIPTTYARRDELIGIARGIAAAGRGVIELVSDLDDLAAELALFEEMAVAAQSRLSFTLLQTDHHPDRWRETLHGIEQAQARGARLFGQVGSRAVGIIMTLEARHPFSSTPTYRSLAAMPVAKRAARMRDPAIRRHILDEQRGHPIAAGILGFDRLFVMGDPPDYEPITQSSIAAVAGRLGIDPAEYCYDLLVDADRHSPEAIVMFVPVVNYAGGNLDVVAQMMEHRYTVLGLGDAGAHVSQICDGSFPTSLLSLWVRDRVRGERRPVEWLVRRQTLDIAQYLGLDDRGVIAPAMRADLNVIDLERVHVQRPTMVHDLPAGGRRLEQRSVGYETTVVSGVVTFERGEHSGALPGRVVRP